MILPQSYLATLILMILGMLCLGSWASTFKRNTKWRFELYYFDFALGAVIAALLAAFTVGTLGFDGFSFRDDLLHAGKKQDLYAVLGGVIFNLGNMLLLAGVSVAGMTIAFPVAAGVGLAVSVILIAVQRPQSNLPFLLGGAVVALLAVAVASSAYRIYKLSLIDELVRTGKLKSTRKVVSLQGIILAAAGGLFLGLFPPMIDLSRVPDIGLGPYSVTFLFIAGIALSTFLFNLFFMNLPVSGQPLEIRDFFTGDGLQHGVSILGGMIFTFGFLALQIGSSVEGPAALQPVLSFGLMQASALIAIVWGFFIWKELPGAEARVNVMIFVTAALLLCGIGMVGLGAAWTRV